jgi:hypothetical protein
VLAGSAGLYVALVDAGGRSLFSSDAGKTALESGLLQQFQYRDADWTGSGVEDLELEHATISMPTGPSGATA